MWEVCEQEVKCAVCSDYDICSECHEKGCHKHHNGEIKEFNELSRPANGYCNACGRQFYPEKTWFQVYHSKECKDYALYFKYRRTWKHYHHIDHLLNVPLEGT